MDEGGGASAGSRAFDVLLHDLARTPDRPPDPERLLHYRILGKLGEGGMGAVYEAEDTKLGRLVAIKRVAARDDDPGARLRLQREARAASALSHPNIVTIFAIEEADGVDFIVMERVEGEPLDALIRRGPLDADRTATLGAEIADALACAHAAGIVHRDIKPSNVVVSARGAKVLDFGIAKPSGGTVSTGAPTGTALTAPGALVGTVPYMSPEQLSAQELDGRSDVFALGCVLYEMATGRRAFPGPGMVACIQQITSGEPPLPRTIVPALPAALEAIIVRALAKDRTRRFATADDLATALRASRAAATARASADVLLGRPSAAEPPLVGRASELARMGALLQRTLEGHGTVALVSGDAGVGKTALLEAFVRRAQVAAPDVLVGRGRCLEPFGAAEAYLPLLDLLDDLLAGPHAAFVRDTLVAAAPTWSLHLPAAQATGVLDALQRGSLGANKERMVRELGDALSALAARSPLLLLLEDVHWVDASTADVLRYLSHRIDRHRILLVATTRPAEVEARGHPLRSAIAEWRAKSSVPEVRLGELATGDVAAWLDARFDPNDFGAGLAAAVRARSEGHALFTAAIIDLLVATGRVRRDERGWHADAVDPGSLPVPESLLGMLRARLDVLSPDDRQLLTLAAVQGAEFLSVIVADVAGSDDVTVDERVAAVAREHHLTRTLGEVELPDGTTTTR
jgi:predicted Ser/Thr protein kinase